ncbi:MAG: glycosyltransferase [Thiohalocapsa sp.]
MADPAVSILLPFRDAAATLPACLASIRQQTLPNYELLFIDDGSVDRGPQLITAVAGNDARIRLSSAPRPGLVAALNHGLRLAAADLVARMDADDLMHPRRLELQCSAMARRPDLTVIASRVRAFPEDRLTAGLRAYLDWQNGCVSPEAIAADLYLESPVVHPSVILRRQPVLRAGGYCEGDFPEDYELWLRLRRSGHGIGKVPQHLLWWRDHDGRVSRTDPRCAREAFDRLRARYLAVDQRVLEASDRLVVWGAGRKTRKRVERLLTAGFEPRAWVDIDPRKIGNRLNGVPVVAPAWLRGRRPKPLVLSYVASHGARSCIEAELARLGYRKGVDYLHVG